MTTVRLTEVEDRTWLDYPFSREVNDIVKSMPVRGFDAQRKRWWVSTADAEALAERLIVEGHDVAGGSDSWAVLAEPAEDSTAEFFAGSVEYDHKAKARDILADIPAQHQGRVYRAMGRILYPEMFAR